MGNCLVVKENMMVQVMKSDGKILEYKAPIKVQQVLTEFSGHVISDSLPVLRHLHPNTKLLPGHLYHLVSSPKKKVSFADPQVQDSHGDRDESGVVRVKLVITKKQLQDMLQKGGVSVNNVLSLVHGQEVIEGDDVCEKTDDGFQRWKPALESIPEVI